MPPFRPNYPVSASKLNQIAGRSYQNQEPLATTGDYDEMAGGTGRNFTDPNPLKILKVTGTVTGGYSFVEQYDPNADGTYTDSTQGFTSNSNFYLVPRSGVTLATNDIVVARKNPFNHERWECICLLSGSGSDPDYSPTVRGYTNTGTQTSAGAKYFQGLICRTGGTNTNTSPYVLINLNTGGMTAAVNTFDNSATQTEMRAGSGVVTGGSFSQCQLFSGNFLTGGAVTWNYAQYVPATPANTYALTYYGVSGSGFSIVESLVIGATLSSDKQGIAFANTAGLAGSVTFDLYATLSEWSGGNGPIRCRQDLYFDDIGEGPCVRSPDGNRWRLGVSNAGVVSASAV